MSNHQRGIQTVELAGEILKLVCSSSKSLSLSEIAELTQLAPGSAYKYLVSLLRTGLLKRNENTLEFEPGSLSLRMGLAKINHDSLLISARELLTQLGDQYKINVFASMWSTHNGPTVVFYQQAGGFFHIGFRLGIQLSLHRTASGRVFVAYMDKSRLDAFSHNIDANEIQLLKTTEFQATLEQIRQQGYSHLVDLPTPGISSFAVPVFNASNEFLMTITAFRNTETMCEDRDLNLIQDLKKIANTLKGQHHG